MMPPSGGLSTPCETQGSSWLRFGVRLASRRKRADLDDRGLGGSRSDYPPRLPRLRWPLPVRSGEAQDARLDVRLGRCRMKWSIRIRLSANSSRSTWSPSRLVRSRITVYG